MPGQETAAGGTCHHGPSQLWSQVLPELEGCVLPMGGSWAVVMRVLGCCDEGPVDAHVAFAAWDEVISWDPQTRHPPLPSPCSAVETAQSCAVQLHKLRFNISFI